MQRHLHLRRAALGVVPMLLAGLATHAGAQTNSYVPAAGGNWNVDANWSLGHCPVGNEIPEIVAGGSANKVVTYNWGALTNFPLLLLDGSATHYAMLNQAQLVLTTVDERIATSGGDAWHFVTGPAYLWVNSNLFTGLSGTGTGHFVLDTVADPSAGVYVGNWCWVGYSTTGEFDHRGGLADIGGLVIGQNAPGTYLMHASSTGLLTLHWQFNVGNLAAGTFDQTGGTVRMAGEDGLTMGINTGGVGTYLMKGGALDIDHLSIAFDGDGYFTQTGGTVTLARYLKIGSGGTHPMRAWYKLDDADGPAVLNVGADLLIGAESLAKYEQTGGTATVATQILMFDGDPGASYSYLYMGLNAGTLTTPAFWNIGGYFDQDGGVLEVNIGLNSSPQGMNLDNNADCRIRTLTHNAGTLTIWRNAILRGPRAFGDIYYLCDFTNNATFQMGSAALSGGSFRGVLVNNGTFVYNQGDFSASTLDNYGTVTLNGDFTCHRLLNHAADFQIPGSRWIYADGAGYASAVENSGTFTLPANSHLDVGTSKIVNSGRLYAGGPAATPATIHGDLENADFLMPGNDALAAGSQLIVTGGFAAAPTAELRIRLGGGTSADYDRLTVQGPARLSGALDVRLTGGFEPALGNRFFPVSWASRSGYFSPVRLPALPTGLMWNVSYGSTQLRLTVVSAPACPGDLDGDHDVDISDLAVLLSNFGTAGGANPADGDLDGDTDVDLSDLATLLGKFGVTC